MDIKNILVMRNDRLGETLLIIPALRALKEKFQEAKITLIANAYLEDLLKNIEYVDKVIAWDNSRHRFSQIMSFASVLKKERFDLCVIFNPSKELHLISFLSGIPLRLGYNRKWGFLLNKKIKDRKYLGDKHEVEFNLELVKLIGAETNNKRLSLKKDNLVNFGQFNPKGYIVVHPYVSDSIKQWPKEQFKCLIELIVAQLGLPVVIIGGKEESDNGRIFNNLGSRIHNLTAKTDLLQLAAILKNARLVISGDSGPMHLACCLDTPVVAIFRNDLIEKGPKRWGPWGNYHRVIQHPSLSEITVEEVFGEVKELNAKVSFS